MKEWNKFTYGRSLTERLTDTQTDFEQKKLTWVFQLRWAKKQWQRLGHVLEFISNNYYQTFRSGLYMYYIKYMYLALYTSSQTQCTCIIIQESSTSCVGDSVTDENQKIGCRSMPLNLCGLTKSLRTPIVHPVTYTIEGWRKVWRHDHVMSRQISRKDGKTRNIKHWASVHVQLWS